MNRRSFLLQSAAAGGLAVFGFVSLRRSEALAALTWGSPMVNGGFGNVITADPATVGRFAVGGDVWGMHHTEDAGVSWTPSMWGATSVGAVYCRAVKVSLLNPANVYYGIGTLKGGGGSFDVCSGYKVIKRSTAIGFGTSLASGAAGTMPRPVGNQIDVIMNGSTEVIVAASNKGIATSTDQGSTWHVSSGTTGVWKCVAAIDPSTYLAARYNASGLTLVKNGVVSHPTAPGVIHDLARIEGTVWAVGPAAIYRWSGSGLSKVASSSFFANTTPVSIDGVGQTIVVGCANPASHSAAVSHDGGSTWAWIGGNAVGSLFGGAPYWLSFARNGFGGAVYDCSQVAVDKRNPQNIMFAGKSGVWGSHDGGQTVHPCGPAGDEVNGLRAGPGAGEFWGTDTDWVGVHTTSDFASVTRTTSPGSCPSTLSVTAGGHAYKVVTATTRDITRDGVSIADDFFRGACFNPTSLAVSGDGTVAIGLYGGGVLVGR